MESWGQQVGTRVTVWEPRTRQSQTDRRLAGQASSVLSNPSTVTFGGHVPKCHLVADFQSFSPAWNSGLEKLADIDLLTQKAG